MGLSRFEGFRIIGPNAGIISAVLESQALFDHADSTAPGLIVLAVVENSMSDIEIQSMADELPLEQFLWIFSKESRPISGVKIFRSTHVPSSSDREFQLKIGSHIARFIKGQPAGSKFVPSRLSFPTMEVKFGDEDPYIPIFDARHTVEKMINGVPFQFFSDLRSSSSKLVVFGQDAITRSRTSLPYFFRWKWADKVNASVLVINDPTLYLDSGLDGAWWIGSRSRDYAAEFVEIVEEIVRQRGIRNEDVVFVGMSAGGFSALQMATLLPGSRAMVDIPRVTLRALGSKGRTADIAVQKCLGFPSALEVPDEYLYRVDVLTRIVEKSYLPEFVYFQNVLDSKHFETQYMYFKSSVERFQDFDESRQRFVEYSQWNLTKGGHFPLKESVMLRFINEYLEGDLQISSSLDRATITTD